MNSTSLIEQIQSAIRSLGWDGWLLYDFRGCNPLARTVLKLHEHPAGSRRWFYYIPAHGSPTRLVHAIETEALASLPGTQRVYRDWRTLQQYLRETLTPGQTIAMEYSPLANNPYVSRIDAGTVELVRACGVQIASSGDLIQQFEACLSPQQWAQHLAADQVTTAAFALAWEFIRTRTADSGTVSEAEVQQRILQHFAENEMVTYSPPIVARQPHNRLPHYETGTGSDTAIRKGDLVLIDLWCKSQLPEGIYSDLTRMGYVGTEIPREYASVFAVVAAARDAGIALVHQRFAEQLPLQGWEVDHAVRHVIEEAGFGDYFLHRTGHSLGAEVHGNGAHLDDLEMHEERRILPRSLFTIEPGIYLESFGIRSEVDVYVDEFLQVHVTGGPAQTTIHSIHG
ncbi:MAG: aminopeptidase P family protein [Planctomycetaceae bacterium]|nr:aminopeptidase P family protein [Planctomycetaceae bacterium]